jgi:NAD(P)H-flavin reductase
VAVAATARPVAVATPSETIRQAYLPATVLAIHRETIDTVTLHLATDDPALLAGGPGQFAMVTLPAFSPAPISISRYRPDGLDLTIRAVGPTSHALNALGRGDQVGLRGPVGRPWPIEAGYGRDVVVVTGGIGLAPLRPLIDALIADRDKFGTLRLYYGARTPHDQLFRDELATWAARGDLDVRLIVDRAGPEWLGRVGIVTHLFDRSTWDGSEAVAFVCGPERMMQATADTLAERGIGPERTYVTLERHMDCGVGLCGHCQMGKFFVCRDGPVFSLAELGGTFGQEGI